MDPDEPQILTPKQLKGAVDQLPSLAANRETSLAVSVHPEPFLLPTTTHSGLPPVVPSPTKVIFHRRTSPDGSVEAWGWKGDVAIDPEDRAEAEGELGIKRWLERQLRQPLPQLKVEDDGGGTVSVEIRVHK